MLCFVVVCFVWLCSTFLLILFCVLCVSSLADERQASHFVHPPTVLDDHVSIIARDVSWLLIGGAIGPFAPGIFMQIHCRWQELIGANRGASS